jgi:transposase-like protein
MVDVGDVACPNRRCGQYGQAGRGNIVSNGTYQTQSGPARRLRCRACGEAFCSRTGSVFYDLRTHAEKVLLAFKLLVKGLPLRGVAEVLGTKLDTVRAWLASGAAQSARVNQLLLQELRVSQVELDALWTFVKNKRLRQRAIRWRARPGWGSGAPGSPA